MSHSSDKINTLAKLFEATRYLEIGVRSGETFLSVKMPHKTAVDPAFAFDTEPYKKPTTLFFPVTSDVFFEDFSARRLQAPYYTEGESPFAFDIIFIDGLHTFEQSYRDFVNSLPYSHKDTIWVFDASVPCDPYSAYPDQAVSYAYRAQAGIHGKPWHGDVYKTIFAIHDFHPEFSYCTQIGTGSHQTIVWQSLPQEREKAFSSLEDIAKLSYFDLLDNAHLLVPVANALAIEMVGLTLSPQEYKNPDDFKRIVKPLVTKKEKELEKMASEKAAFEGENGQIEDRLKQLEGENTKLKAKVKQQEEKNAEMQKQHECIKQSLSWRITTPLRWVEKKFEGK